MYKLEDFFPREYFSFKNSLESFCTYGMYVCMHNSSIHLICFLEYTLSFINPNF